MTSWEYGNLENLYFVSIWCDIVLDYVQNGFDVVSSILIPFIVVQIT